MSFPPEELIPTGPHPPPDVPSFARGWGLGKSGYFYVTSKISTKGKTLPRVLTVTKDLFMMTNEKGELKRILKFDEIAHVVLQPRHGGETNMLFKTTRPEAEPSLWLLSNDSDRRNTITAMELLYAMSAGYQAATGRWLTSMRVPASIDLRGLDFPTVGLFKKGPKYIGVRRKTEMIAPWLAQKGSPQRSQPPSASAPPRGEEQLLPALSYNLQFLDVHEGLGLAVVMKDGVLHASHADQGTPAGRAGVVPGVIVSLDGVPCHTTEEIVGVNSQRATAGRTVSTLVLYPYRNGGMSVRHYRLLFPNVTDDMGVGATSLQNRTLHLTAPQPNGVLARCGVPPGMVLAYHGVQVHSLQDMEKANNIRLAEGATESSMSLLPTDPNNVGTPSVAQSSVTEMPPPPPPRGAPPPPPPPQLPPLRSDQTEYVLRFPDLTNRLGMSYTAYPDGDVHITEVKAGGVCGIAQVVPGLICSYDGKLVSSEEQLYEVNSRRIAEGRKEAVLRIVPFKNGTSPEASPTPHITAPFTTYNLYFPHLNDPLGIKYDDSFNTVAVHSTTPGGVAHTGGVQPGVLLRYDDVPCTTAADVERADKKRVAEGRKATSVVMEHTPVVAKVPIQEETSSSTKHEEDDVWKGRRLDSVRIAGKGRRSVNANHGVLPPEYAATFVPYFADKQVEYFHEVFLQEGVRSPAVACIVLLTPASLYLCDRSGSTLRCIPRECLLAAYNFRENGKVGITLNTRDADVLLQSADHDVFLDVLSQGGTPIYDASLSDLSNGLFRFNDRTAYTPPREPTHAPFNVYDEAERRAEAMVRNNSILGGGVHETRKMSPIPPERPYGALYGSTSPRSIVPPMPLDYGNASPYARGPSYERGGNISLIRSEPPLSPLFAQRRNEGNRVGRAPGGSQNVGGTVAKPKVSEEREAPRRESKVVLDFDVDGGASSASPSPSPSSPIVPVSFSFQKDSTSDSGSSVDNGGFANFNNDVSPDKKKVSFGSDSEAKEKEEEKREKAKKKPQKNEDIGMFEVRRRSRSASSERSDDAGSGGGGGGGGGGGQSGKVNFFSMGANQTSPESSQSAGSPPETRRRSERQEVEVEGKVRRAKHDDGFVHVVHQHVHVHPAQGGGGGGPRQGHVVHPRPQVSSVFPQFEECEVEGSGWGAASPPPPPPPPPPATEPPPRLPSGVNVTLSQNTQNSTAAADIELQLERLRVKGLQRELAEMEAAANATSSAPPPPPAEQNVSSSSSSSSAQDAHQPQNSAVADIELQLGRLRAKGSQREKEAAANAVNTSAPPPPPPTERPPTPHISSSSSEQNEQPSAVADIELQLERLRVKGLQRELAEMEAAQTHHTTPPGQHTPHPTVSRAPPPSTDSEEERRGARRRARVRRLQSEEEAEVREQRRRQLREEQEEEERQRRRRQRRQRELEEVYEEDERLRRARVLREDAERVARNEAMQRQQQEQEDDERAHISRLRHMQALTQHSTERRRRPIDVEQKQDYASHLENEVSKVLQEERLKVKGREVEVLREEEEEEEVVVDDDFDELFEALLAEPLETALDAYPSMFLLCFFSCCG